MPGAGKKRGKIDKKNGSAPAAAEQQPAAEASFDPPPPAGRGRPVDNPAPSGSRDISVAGSAAGPPRDPARDAAVFLNRNVDFAGNAYSLINKNATTLMPRPKYNTSGKAVQININSHKIVEYPNKTVYQYDVVIGNGAEKRGLVKNVWESKTVRNHIGQGFIFDGNKIGWSLKEFKDELRFIVDLDQERGVTAKEGRPPNTHRVCIRKTSAVNLAAITGYLEGKMQFGNTVLEAINFLDHLLRETPSKAHIAMKRSYFGRDTEERVLLGGGVEAMKGVYQSIRAAEGRRLVVNVDVSNTTFWHETSISQLAMMITGSNNMLDVTNRLRSVKGGGATGGMKESVHFAALRRLCKNDIYVRFRNAGPNLLKKTFKIDRISQFSARTFKFDMPNRTTGQVEKQITVEQYFQKRYNVFLEYPDLPLIEVGKRSTMYPMEICHMGKGQKYPYKLDEVQTSAMIKFAVSRPEARKAAIRRGLEMLDWRNDPYLNGYGLKIDPNMLSTNARVLNPPEVGYKNGTSKPGYSGRWDLRGKVFLTPNPTPLKSWGLSVIGGRPPSPDAVKAFIKQFILVYRGHGGIVENTEPVIMEGGNDGAKAVENLFNKTGNANQYRPQLMFFVLPTKNAEMYNRIKKSADCRYGIVSQCVQQAHLIKNQAQYHSNVCMKVNAKLGGTTCRVAARGTVSPFPVPTMIIGADVSHAAPGSNGASFAAVTVSMDKIAARYAAAVETNGIRVEMIATKNLEDMLKPLIQHWEKNVGGGRLPSHVYYFRDGVSEGQYSAVLQQEVSDMRAIFAELGRNTPGFQVKFTVVVAEKRHHIRFFPNPGPGADRNMNPVPGTLVERDVTHPFEYDFYLCSHAAIQGTARPTHYHILMDECELKGDAFQAMLYEHSYQYMRATTPVSLFPAVYYAHLASNRARSHLDMSQTAMELQKKSGGSSSEKPETETRPLIEMANQTGIKYSMWSYGDTFARS